MEQQSAAHQRQPPLKRPRPVLIVDDEPTILDLLRDVLEDEGIAVLTAANGAAALALIRRTPVALVLTDLMMPRLTGTELARQLHSDPQTTKIPLILMSAISPQQGGDTFVAMIQKPFSVDSVVKVVRQFLPE